MVSEDLVKCRSWCALATLPVPAAGRPDPADPVLPRLPQGPEPADVPQPGRPLRAHQPAPPHGRGEEAQAQLLMAPPPPSVHLGTACVVIKPAKYGTMCGFSDAEKEPELLGHDLKTFCLFPAVIR